MAHAKKSEAARRPPEPEEAEEIIPVQRAQYAFKPGALCPFCGQEPATAELDVDLNLPLHDWVAVFDDSVPNLPCCSDCRAGYLKRSARALALPEWPGYVASVLHRLSYRGKILRWLRENAQVVKTQDRLPPALRKEMVGRALGVLGHSALITGSAVALVNFSSTVARGGDMMYLGGWAMIVVGGIGLAIGAFRWIRWTLEI
jgi:hypothetical protein